MSGSRRRGRRRHSYTTPRGPMRSHAAAMALSSGVRAITVRGACVSSDLSKFSQTYPPEMGCRREAIKNYGGTVRQVLILYIHGRPGGWHQTSVMLDRRGNGEERQGGR